MNPMVQLVFDKLFDAFLRELCYVVGKVKQGIEDHFIPDAQYIETLEGMEETAKTQT